LVRSYEAFAGIPWPRHLAGAQRVWFAIYDKSDERRLRARLEEFELSTKKSGHRWQLEDLTDAFPAWLSAEEYRDDYFASPSALKPALSAFRAALVARLRALIDQANTETIVAVLGVGSLFGFTKVSDLIHEVESSIKGRLLVFFPGEYEGNNFRLLDARDGWNYLAVPIMAHEGPS
jgi:hypothetical protein